jgi:anti-sigma-K factor RskA
MPMDCETACEHLDAWALGALDAEDARPLESHLAGCADCAAVADAAREHAAMIAMAVPLAAASSTLKARVMASARALSDIGRGGVSRWWRTVAAAAAAISIAALSWGAVMQMRAGDLRDDRSALAAGATAQSADLAAVHTQVVDLAIARDELDKTVEMQNTILAVALRQDVEWTSLDSTEIAPGASARCAWSRTLGLGAFIAQNLPPPPSGKAYYMWLVYENTWVNAGRFDVDSEGRGHLVLHRIWSEESPGKLAGFAVTMEDLAKPTRPSDQLVLTSPPP